MKALAAWIIALMAAPVLAGCMSVNGQGQEPIDDAAWGIEGLTLIAAHGGKGDGIGPVDAAIATADFDGDGTDELVVPSKDRKVHVFSSDGELLVSLPSRYPPSWHVERVLNPAAAAVMEPGQPPMLVATNAASYVTAWRPVTDGGTLGFEKAWETRTDGCYPSPGMDGGATLADLDGDGVLEVLVQTEEVGFFALRADGSEMWHHCWAGGNSGPIVDDLDGDGRLEAIFASDSGFISVIDGKTGQPQWTFDAADDKYGIDPASVTVEPTIADLDGQLPKEVLFTTRYAPDDAGDDYGSFHMAIFAVHQDPQTHQGELVWLRQPDWAHPLSNTRLIVTDADGDGETDVFGMDWNTIGHRPGNWENLGPAHLFRLDSQGRDVWVREVDTWWSNKNIAIGDLDGDGENELLVNAPDGEVDALWRFDAATGKPEGSFAMPGWKAARGPQIVDTNEDGLMEVVFPAVAADGSARGAILHYDLGVPFATPTEAP